MMFVILKHGHKSTYVQNLHQFLTFQKKGKRDYSYLKLPKTWWKLQEYRILWAMSVEDQYLECHEIEQQSHHNPPSSLMQTILKPTIMKSFALLPTKAFPPHQCKAIFVISALKMTKLIKICVQKSPKFHKLTSCINEYWSKAAMPREIVCPVLLKH